MRTLKDYINEEFNYSGNGDEFYTQLKDIEKELSHYNFNGKVIYCNCDNPSFSNFWKYFYENFDKLGLKMLLSTFYGDDPKLTIYDGKNKSEEKIKSGRFQDNEDVISKYKVDIIVTNPPYSDNMPAELVKLCLKSKIDFIFVGPLHLITNSEAFKLIKDGKLNCGYTNVNSFETPSGKSKNAPAAWFTSFDVEHPLYKAKSDEIPDKYDDYDAIECNPSSAIPKNYDGKMGVPYRFLTKLNRKQFNIHEIVEPTFHGVKKMKRVIISYK